MTGKNVNKRGAHGRGGAADSWADARDGKKRLLLTSVHTRVHVNRGQLKNEEADRMRTCCDMSPLTHLAAFAAKRPQEGILCCKRSQRPKTHTHTRARRQKTRTPTSRCVAGTHLRTKNSFPIETMWQKAATFTDVPARLMAEWNQPLPPSPRSAPVLACCFTPATQTHSHTQGATHSTLLPFYTAAKQKPLHCLFCCRCLFAVFPPIPSFHPKHFHN